MGGGVLLLLSKGPKITVMHFSFKGPRNYTDF